MEPTKNMRDAIELCWECRTTCLDTLFNYCLEKSGMHAAPDHVRLMTDCIDICQMSADFMRRNSALHGTVCRACADICEACAESCAGMEDDRMQACASICERCADTCRSMSTLAVFQQKEAAEVKGAI